MAKIIRTYRQKVPAMRFIGRKYLDADRVDGTFAAHWGEWFKQGWFEKLQSTFDPKALYEDGDATVGLMRWKEEEPSSIGLVSFVRKVRQCLRVS